MKLENRVLILPKNEAVEIEKNYYFEQIADRNVVESAVDTLIVNILKKIGYVEHIEIKQKRTNITNVDQNIPSKTIKGTGKGELDISVFVNDGLKIIIEDKEPKPEKLQEAIDDAIYYANGLRKKGNGVKIAIGSNGIECIVRVFDESVNDWVPFYINGEELKALPGRKLMEIIYSYNNINSIVIEERNDDINIQQIVQNLKTTYRNLKHIQNDNQKTIDFTIAFIALMSILEKYGEKIDKSWKSINAEKNQDLRDNIVTVTNRVLKNIGDKFDEIFIIKDGDNETFNFIKLINGFETENELKALREIYNEISGLHDLHSSQIDLFGEVYESLGNKDTKKSFGQYFTRRHIIKTLIKLLFENQIEQIIGNTEIKVKGKNTRKVAIQPKSICDPACGTGGFLTESFKYIAEMTSKNPSLEDLSLPDLADKMFYGYDIYSSNAVRTKINMYLAGDGFSEIEQRNSLEDLKDEKFDFVVTNPPYGKGEVVVNTDVINSTRLEVNFLIKIVDLLKPNGQALVIIPDGVLESTILTPLREWFLKNCQLEKVISLPKHTFAPYTHEKTFAIYFRKRPIPLDSIMDSYHERVWMYIVDNDGYLNSDKRFRTGKIDENGKWLHDEMSEWRRNDGRIMPSLLEERWCKKEQTSGEKFFNEWGEEISNKKYGYISMAKVLEDEVTYYRSVASQEILKTIKEIEMEDFPNNVNCLFRDDGQLKSEYKDILNKKGIIYENQVRQFIDSAKKPKINQLKHSDLLKLLTQENTLLGAKRITDLYCNNRLRDEAIKLLAQLNIEYNESQRKFWFKDKIEYKTVSSENVLKVIEAELKKKIPTNISEVFEYDEDGTKTLKSIYNEILEKQSIVFDEYEEKFFDQSSEIIKKILILTPEKYLRNDLEEPMTIEVFSAETTELLNRIKLDLRDLMEDRNE